MQYTGYGAANAILTELEELKALAQARANDLNRDVVSRAGAQATADAYAYCQLRIQRDASLCRPTPTES